MKRWPVGEYDFYETPFGWVGAATTREGLAAVSLPQPDVQAEVERIHENFHSLKQVRNELLTCFFKLAEGYFSGQRVDFGPLETDLSWAAPFSLKVYRYVMAIPYGKTATYKQVAEAVGSQGACRAVGGAMGRNRIPLIIPCHRVVGARGPGGFTGAAIEVKEALINLERSFSVAI